MTPNSTLPAAGTPTVPQHLTPPATPPCPHQQNSLAAVVRAARSVV